MSDIPKIAVWFSKGLDRPTRHPERLLRGKHRGLAGTIAEPGSLRFNDRAMSCHEHPVSDEAHCVGWLAHQLGAGNNIGLRLRMRNCENIGSLKLHGEQHQTFEDTLP